jgi:hypothetical protein
MFGAQAGEVGAPAQEGKMRKRSAAPARAAPAAAGEITSENGEETE